MWQRGLQKVITKNNWLFHFTLWTGLKCDATWIWSVFGSVCVRVVPISTLFCFAKHYCNRSSRKRREFDVRGTAACATSPHCSMDVSPGVIQKSKFTSLIMHSFYRRRSGCAPRLVSSTWPRRALFCSWPKKSDTNKIHSPKSISKIKPAV